MGKDHTLFALTDGVVKYTTYAKTKKRASVIATEVK
jgi:ribosomal protein L27